MSEYAEIHNKANLEKEAHTVARELFDAMGHKDPSPDDLERIAERKQKLALLAGEVKEVGPGRVMDALNHLLGDLLDNAKQVLRKKESLIFASIDEAVRGTADRSWGTITENYVRSLMDTEDHILQESYDGQIAGYSRAVGFVKAVEITSS
jgi:hypothetical protein